LKNEVMPAEVKNHGPKRALSLGRASTRRTTVASSPRPEEKVKARSLTSGRSMWRTSQRSARPSRCSVASTISLGMPSIRHSTFVLPPGSGKIGVSDPISPLTASLTVPSPPNVTTAS